MPTSLLMINFSFTLDEGFMYTFVLNTWNRLTLFISTLSLTKAGKPLETTLTFHFKTTTMGRTEQPSDYILVLPGVNVPYRKVYLESCIKFIYISFRLGCFTFLGFHELSIWIWVALH